MKGLASHIGTEACAAVRKVSREALIKKGIGRVLSREINIDQGTDESRGADAVGGCGRPQVACRFGEIRVSPARSEALCMYRNNPSGNREIPCLSEAVMVSDRIEKSKDVMR